MFVQKMTRYLAPLAVAGLVPFAAHADDAALSADEQACVENCVTSEKAAKATKATKAKAKKAPMVVVAPDPMPPQAVIDGIRAEERARAAEELNADQQETTATHEAELQRVKAEEHARMATEAQQQLASERLRYEQALAKERMKNDNEKIENALITPAGVYGFLGGGVSNFTESSPESATQVGGYWDARVGIGTRSILGAEVAYVGSARDISALGLASDAVLISNGLEGVARLNVPITPTNTDVLIEPYTFGGVGWNRFDVASASPNTSSIEDVDNVMTVPLGIGLAVGFSGLTLDARATYRHTLGSDLVASSSSSFSDSSLNSLGLGAALGFEF
ncbi:MAG: hypothetical protein Q8O67_05685 [Deltaproteobacteria bacterium]|nr:hypothetical protein [Deltaproteobacteria bacterium]